MQNESAKVRTRQSMGFDVKIIAKVSFHEGTPYTRMVFQDTQVNYVLSIPTIPDEWKDYTNIQGRFWSQFFPSEEWIATDWFLENCLPENWEDVEEPDDDYREDFEKLKGFLEWCGTQDCEFMILGWG